MHLVCNSLFIFLPMPWMQCRPWSHQLPWRKSRTKMPWRPPEARTASCAILHLVYGVDLLLFVCVTWVGGWWATWGRQGLYGLHIATVIWCNLFVCDVFVWLQLCDWHHQWSTLQDGPPGPHLAVKCTSCLASWAWLWKMHQMANCQKCQEPWYTSLPFGIHWRQ